MCRLATALFVALMLLAPTAGATGPDEMTYPPQPGDKLPADPEADTPKPGMLDPSEGPGDTPWRYLVEEGTDGETCYCWCDVLRPQSVPEPGALALLALGAVGLVVARRARG